MEEFRAQLLETIGESNLPIDAIYYVLKDVYKEVEEQYLPIREQFFAARAAMQQNKEAEVEKPQPEETEEVKE